jgi:two-component system CheB/CheR fusion protein
LLHNFHIISHVFFFFLPLGFNPKIMSKPAKKQPQKTEQNFPIVGIGASAGGLDAFKKLLSAVSLDSGMAYVIVQHLSRDYDSNLTEILTQCTKLPVYEIINDINLAPNCVYIIPENTNLITVDGVLKLDKRSRNAKKNESIDIFFRSLAEVHKSFSIGVILSGTAFDGTAGLKRIKEEGGATIAQDPETAAFKGMPQNAIDADTADFILAPEDIPAQLLKIHDSYETNFGYSDQEHIPQDEEEVLNQIVNVVFLRSGNDFRHYKQPTIRRRIARRMVLLRKETLQDYYNVLRIDKPEQDLLFNDFLIPVTYFFRDLHFFETLPEEVFPQLVQNAVNNNLRIWVAGCSTGEEAYSIAISLHEYLSEKNHKDIKVQIFASDISEKSINKARTAMYSPQDVQNISDARLNNYFSKRDGSYQINKVIRDMCVFAVHNFIKDPPFAKIDMVSCRNVLIYLNSQLQNKVLGSFHYSLKEKGFLLLGKSETAANVQNLFEPISKHERIYNRKFAPGRYVPEAFKPAHINTREKSQPADKKVIHDADFRKLASDVLFSKYTPPSVIINEHYDIVHFHGDTSDFLLPSPGKPNFNILKMAREGISFELRNALIQIKNQRETIVKENVLVKNQPYRATFEVVPLNNTDQHLIVLFYKKPLPDIDNDAKNKRKSADQQRINELENELSQLREDIKRVTEEQQTAFEELQTTNEELLSSSEELQALNEELETSTEELQSNNEELMCVNDELLDRQDQLISMQNYLESIIKTIREPLIIIDQEFVIKNANTAFYKYFGYKEGETEGQSFFEIGNCQWNIPEFKNLFSNMLSKGGAINDFKIETVCPGLGKKIMIVNARHIVDAKPAGLILVALEDITDVIMMNDLLIMKNNELKLHNEQLQSFSSSASHDLQEPLRKINMFCKKIIDDDKKLADSTRRSLERVIVSISTMSGLITDLIEFTKNIVVVKDYKNTDINQLLKKTVTDLKDIMAEKNAKVVISPLPYLNVLPSQIQQLFTNLIINSIKYSDEKAEPEIIIDTEQPAREEISEIGGNTTINYIKINVKDNGIGFDPQYANRVFEPFCRLHSKDEYRGSGLGLTLAKKIVMNHNGFITAGSQKGKGTVISIFLPLS